MQLKIYLLGIILTFCSLGLSAQDGEQRKDERPKDPIEINFLSNYYEQDGNHSPVTGGIGDEKLSNISQTFQINIPVKRNFTIGLSGGLEFFSSASQQGVADSTNYEFEEDDDDRSDGDDEDDEDEDDDDDDYYSGASPVRPARSLIKLLNANLTKENDEKKTAYTVGLGYYSDDNATSYSTNFSLKKSTADNNNTFALTANYFLDQWAITPEDRDEEGLINGTGHLDKNLRHTAVASLSFSRNLSKRITGAIMADVIYQKGLLSTPYHTVNFADNELPASERLPDSRIKFPVGMRLNFHPADFMIIRSYYRFYYDTWGITANTASIELPVKAGPWLRIYPFYRFHSQQGADHFGPHATLSSTNDFYTADYDLSTLISHKMGLGFSISPVNGIVKSKDKAETGRSFMFKSIDMRYAHYRRNDGLSGHMVTASMNFEIYRRHSARKK